MKKKGSDEPKLSISFQLRFCRKWVFAKCYRLPNASLAAKEAEEQIEKIEKERTTTWRGPSKGETGRVCFSGGEAQGPRPDRLSHI